MAEAQDNAEVAAALRELAKQVDALGNAVITAANAIAKAIHDGINVNGGKQPGRGEGQAHAHALGASATRSPSETAATAKRTAHCRHRLGKDVESSHRYGLPK